MKRSQLNRLGIASGATEPVSVADAKSWSAIDTSLDDAVISAIIVSAREMCETYLSRDVIAKDYEYFEPSPESGEDGCYYVVLPRPTSEGLIASVSDSNGTLTASTDWEMYGVNGRIIKLLQAPSGAVTVTFESLPVTSESDLELIKSGIKSLAEQIYDNRANLEGDSDIMVLDRNIKMTLKPAKYVYF